MKNRTYLLSPVWASGGPQISNKGSPSRSVLNQRHDVVVVQVLLPHLTRHRSSPGVSWSSHVSSSRGCPADDLFWESVLWHTQHMPITSLTSCFDHFYYRLLNSPPPQFHFADVVKPSYLQDVPQAPALESSHPVFNFFQSCVLEIAGHCVVICNETYLKNKSLYDK